MTIALSRRAVLRNASWMFCGAGLPSVMSHDLEEFDLGEGLCSEYNSGYALTRIIRDVMANPMEFAAGSFEWSLKQRPKPRDLLQTLQTIPHAIPGETRSTAFSRNYARPVSSVRWRSTDRVCPRGIQLLDGS